MLRTWARTKILGTNVQDHGVWAELLWNFLAQVCCRFVWQTKWDFPELIFSLSPVSCGVFFVCSLRLLTLWQVKSSWIVREWLFVLPTCCHCGFDCLSRQHGLTHNHSLTVTPVDGHSFWQGSQMALQVLCGLQPSEGVIDCVSERLSSMTTKSKSCRPFAHFLSCWEFKLLGKMF